VRPPLQRQVVLGLVLQQAVRTIFGPTNREVGAPSYMSGGFELMGLAITYNRLWIIVFTLAVFCILLAILLPPLGVFLQVGIGLQFWINILLTLLGYLPGIIHAVWVIATVGPNQPVRA